MSFAERDGLIWLDGEFIPWREAQVHLLTHSLHYGLAVFEGVRAYKTDKGAAIFRLNDHTKRLFESAKILKMQIPYDFATLDKVQREALCKNHLDSGYIRPIVFYGSEKMGLSVNDSKIHVGVAAWSWGKYLGDEGINKGIRVKTSSFTRHHVNAAMCRAKSSGNYLNSIMANSEATKDGYDEGLLLDTEGYVAEGAGENIFVIRKNQIFTPDLASCLDGITRNTVIKIATDLGYQVIETRFTRDLIYIADEAFFTGTAAEITPIRELDNCVIGNGTRGPITEKIQQTFFDIVSGKNSQYSNWLDYAN